MIRDRLIGTRPSKQKLGTSWLPGTIDMLRPSHRSRVNSYYEVTVLTASTSLLDKFDSGVLDWSGEKVHFGLIASGESLSMI